MGRLMDTLGNVRTEIQKRLYDGNQDTTAPILFIDDLVYGDVVNRDSLLHQKDVAQKDAVAKYIVVKIAENALDDGFRLVKKVGDEEEIMPEITKGLKRLGFKRFMTEAVIAERMHGHGYLYTGTNKFRQDWVDAGLEGGEIGGLDAFTPMNAKVLNDDYDENGNPTFVTVWTNPNNQGDTKRLPFKEFIQVMTRPKGRSDKGYPATYSVWTELAYIRISKHALNFAHGKWGLGLLLLWSKGTLTSEVQSQIEEMLEGISNSRAGLINMDDIDRAEWTGPSGGGTTDITQGIDMYLGLVSAGTGIPKDILTGISAGAITGSEINSKELYATLNQVQKSIEPFIRELIRRMGHNGEDYEIDWNTRYATDEKEQAEIEVSHVSAQVARLQYYTMNEVRAIDNMKRVEGGDETPGAKDDFNIGFSGLSEPTGPEEQEQTRNKEGKQI